MPPTKKTTDFLKQKYSEYYQQNKVQMPERFGRREFAFMFFNEQGMLRHLAFKRANEVHKFLQKRAPAHVYYSSAYYKHPDASSMAKKGWMGAELIFDLDADHIPNAEKLTYEESLKRIKAEFRKLVQDFLISDFGFTSDEVYLYFSGGRGYHCHVISPKILRLNSSERREIVDYITARDLKENLIFKEHVVERFTRKSSGKSYPKTKRLEMPRTDEGGWRGRISRTIISMLQELSELNQEEAMEKLRSYDIGKKTAQKIIDTLSKEKIKRVEEGLLDQSTAIRQLFLRGALQKIAVSLSAGETDEPVTCDVKRLIRLPTSLHGKTGFKVTPIDIDKIMEFNPLNDAVVFGDQEVKVQIDHSTSICLKNSDYDFEKGETISVPEHVAVFLLGRGMANII